jgi:hypothetical protein
MFENNICLLVSFIHPNKPITNIMSFISYPRGDGPQWYDNHRTPCLGLSDLNKGSGLHPSVLLAAYLEPNIKIW